MPTQMFKDEDRVSHAEKGLGTVTRDPAADDLIVPPKEEAKDHPTQVMVYVVWDDDRFPVGKVPAEELEKVPPAAAAISTGV
ncbi:MAG: hypothetical protein QM667_04815 [Asticcacaulis sp.]